VKLRIVAFIAVMIFLAAVVLPVRLAAQESQEQLKKARPHYNITDLGALGGSNSVPWGINDRGQVVGGSETPDIDPNSGFPTFHAFLWNKGVMHDLGTLGGQYSQALLGGINSDGQVVGEAETSTVDPNNPPFFATHAFLWEKGAMHDLGTLGGTHSYAMGIDSESRVVGAAQTDEPHPFFGQQYHPFLWKKGVMRDLGTLGGDLGFATGISVIDAPHSREDGVADKEQAPKTRNKGHSPFQVVGGSIVDNNPTPPFLFPMFSFLWEGGVMTNLGALGGIQSFPEAINDRSQVVGEFTVLDSVGTGISHAFRWEDGRRHDLGTVAGDTDSIAYAINHKGQIVGASGSGFIDLPFNPVHAFLWEHGVLTDLNTLIPANSDLQLIAAYGINARGQIAALAFEFSSGTVRALLLNPHDSTSANQGTASATQTATAQRPQVILPENVRNLLQMATPGSRIKAGLNHR
jgi:probable HAF family extracellular repeat protein